MCRSLRIGCVSAVENSGVKGNANNDGKVGVSDLVMMAGYLTGKTYSNLNYQNSDYNADGNLNISLTLKEYEDKIYM